jgi:hypothetical protein
MSDNVNNPPHYTAHESGLEAIDVCEHFNFNLGNALKYLWRRAHKGRPKEDLEKAAWYLRREIDRREKRSFASRLWQYIRGIGELAGYNTELDPAAYDAIERVIFVDTGVLGKALFRLSQVPPDLGGALDAVRAEIIVTEEESTNANRVA